MSDGRSAHVLELPDPGHAARPVLLRSTSPPSQPPVPSRLWTGSPVPPCPPRLLDTLGGHPVRHRRPCPPLASPLPQSLPCSSPPIPSGFAGICPPLTLRFTANGALWTGGHPGQAFSQTSQPREEGMPPLPGRPYTPFISPPHVRNRVSRVSRVCQVPATIGHSADRTGSAPRPPEPVRGQPVRPPVPRPVRGIRGVRRPSSRRGQADRLAGRVGSRLPPRSPPGLPRGVAALPWGDVARGRRSTWSPW